jgi:hypothetical protein
MRSLLDAHVRHLQREADGLQESLELLHRVRFSPVGRPLMNRRNKVAVESSTRRVTDAT